MNPIYVEYVEVNTVLYFFLAVRKVAGGHKMVSEGHIKIMAGWEMFEEAVAVAGAGDLPQLFRGLKGMTTPHHH